VVLLDLKETRASPRVTRAIQVPGIGLHLKPFQAQEILFLASSPLRLDKPPEDFLQPGVFGYYVVKLHCFHKGPPLTHFNG
jgi:hypothetical protein